MLVDQGMCWQLDPEAVVPLTLAPWHLGTSSKSPSPRLRTGSQPRRKLATSPPRASFPHSHHAPCLGSEMGQLWLLWG